LWYRELSSVAEFTNQENQPCQLLSKEATRTKVALAELEEDCREQQKEHRNWPGVFSVDFVAEAAELFFTSTWRLVK
jgi:hypothetical protein